jgi:hypothetical protein
MKKQPNVKDRLMSEYILLGGEIMTRSEAVAMLQSEGVDPRAIDVCVFGSRATALTEEEMLGFARVGLLLTLHTITFNHIKRKIRWYDSTAQEWTS